MIGAETSVETNTDTAAGVETGVRRALLDAAGKGFQVSQQRVPTDRGELRLSGVQPTVLGDGSVVWGYNADHARAMEHGTPPFTPPIQPLLDWGRRVVGSEAAGARAWWKIRREGIDPQPYVQPGIDAMRARLRSTGISAFIEEVL